MRKAQFGLVVALLASTVPGACVSPAPTFQFDAATCSTELAAAGARCGSVRVPEDYSKTDGRMIALNVIVLPALRDDGVRDAQFDLEGGPGLAVTDAAAFYLGPGGSYRETRDMVLLDMRGTGASNPLRCPEIEVLEQADPWAPMYPPALVTQCAARLAAVADLNHYTTRNAAKDLESVRVALGYETVSLFAMSYGTSLALTYMADYPHNVRTAVLVGTAPPDSAPPRDHAPNAAKALAALFAVCSSDPPCHAQYPDPATDFAVAQQQLGAERAEIFAEWLRSRMYTPEGARKLPYLLHLAAQGDFSALATGGGPEREFADGLYLSMTCSENFPHINLPEASAAARATLFGDYRLRRQEAACAQWPVKPSGPVMLADAMSPAVLFVSGELDPVTPPAWADRVVGHFPDSRHIVLPGSGHIFDGMTGIDTCLDPLMVAFLDTGDARGLNVDCVAAMRAPAFAAGDPSR